MPVGDTERAFQACAAADGITLTRAKASWLNQRGHLGLPEAAAGARAALADIFDALDGDISEQAQKRLTSLPGDFFHVASGTFIEIDESQHFTSWRMKSLELYPANAPLGYDLDHYKDLCATWESRSDRYRASKPAKGFGASGRQRQRAYHDALRDLAAPAMGHPPVIRIAAPDRDGVAAYARSAQWLSPLYDH